MSSTTPTKSSEVVKPPPLPDNIRDQWQGTNLSTAVPEYVTSQVFNFDRGACGFDPDMDVLILHLHILPQDILSCPSLGGMTEVWVVIDLTVRENEG